MGIVAMRGLDQSFGMLSQTRIAFAIKVIEGLQAPAVGIQATFKT
jgi:hypothetical protein